jgi:hypothetical protein
MEILTPSARKRNKTTSREAALGILPKARPAAPAVASSPSDFLSSDLNDSLILRYVRQSAARRLLKNERVSWCLRRVVEDQAPAILIDKPTNRAHWGGLMSCGRVFQCPVCAAKISQRRREELSKMVSDWRSDGMSLFMATYTFKHAYTDDLATTMQRLKKCWSAFIASRAYKSVMKDVNQVGTVRALEITFGRNGWHPHFHQIIFSENYHGKTDLFSVRERLFDEWRKQCIRYGLGEPTLKHGVDVRDASHVQSYVSKWGIEDEITKFNSKKALRGGLSPFQLLSEYIEGDKQAGALFREFVSVFKSVGARQLYFSAGLKKLFKLENTSDEEIAAVQDSTGFVLSTFTLEEWAEILRHSRGRRDVRAELLRLAEQGGLTLVNVFLASLSGSLAHRSPELPLEDIPLTASSIVRTSRIVYEFVDQSPD